MLAILPRFASIFRQTKQTKERNQELDGGENLTLHTHIHTEAQWIRVHWFGPFRAHQIRTQIPKLIVYFLCFMNYPQSHIVPLFCLCDTRKKIFFERRFFAFVTA